MTPEQIQKIRSQISAFAEKVKQQTDGLEEEVEPIPGIEMVLGELKTLTKIGALLKAAGDFAEKKEISKLDLLTAFMVECDIPPDVFFGFMMGALGGIQKVAVIMPQHGGEVHNCEECEAHSECELPFKKPKGAVN